MIVAPHRAGSGGKTSRKSQAARLIRQTAETTSLKICEYLFGPLPQAAHFFISKFSERHRLHVVAFALLQNQTRTPAGRQLEQIRSTAFSDWYALKKAAVIIVRDDAITNATG